MVAQWQSGGRTPKVAGSIPVHNQHAPLVKLAKAPHSDCGDFPGSNPGRGTTRHGSIIGGDSGKGGCDIPPPHRFGVVAHHARLLQGVPGQPGATAVRVRRQKGRRVLTFAPALRSAGTVIRTRTASGVRGNISPSSPGEGGSHDFGIRWAHRCTTKSAAARRPSARV